MAVRQAELCDHGLLEIKILLPLERALHVLLIAPPVSLRAEGVDGGALTEVQHAVLDARAVGSLCHFPAQRVKLPYQMALARAADGGVAGHVADGVEIDCKHDSLQSHPRAGKPGLNAGMARADNGDVVGSSVKFHSNPSNTGAILSANRLFFKKPARVRKKIPPRQRSADFSPPGCYLIATAYPMRAHFISLAAASRRSQIPQPHLPRPELWPGSFFDAPPGIGRAFPKAPLGSRGRFLLSGGNGL